MNDTQFELDNSVGPIQGSSSIDDLLDGQYDYYEESRWPALLLSVLAFIVVAALAFFAGWYLRGEKTSEGSNPAPTETTTSVTIPSLTELDSKQSYYSDWSFEGYDPAESLLISDVVAGGVYCWVDGNAGPFFTFTATTGQPRPFKDYDPYQVGTWEGEQLIIDVYEQPLEFVVAAQLGLAPWSDGAWELNGLTFAGACPGELLNPDATVPGT